MPESGGAQVGDCAAEEIARIPDAKIGVRYRRHPVFVNYIVSSEGFVYSTQRNGYQVTDPHRKIYYKLSGMKDPDGYLRVTMRPAGRVIGKPVHQMVLETFLGLKPFPKAEGAHGNAIRTDNRLVNLRWATKRGNDDDKIGHHSHKGTRNAAHKLTDVEVIEIRAHPYSWGYREFLSSKYGVSKILISKIRAKKIWKHLL